MNKVAIVDVDDTLGNMRELLSEALNKHSGKDLNWQEWHGYSLEDVYNITNEQFFDILKSEKIIERMRSHDESLQFTNTLKKLGYKVVLLTARAWHPDSKNVTTNWATNSKIEFDDLVICNVTDCKSEIINHTYGGADITVDDSASHCRAYVKNENVRKVFVYDMPWNKCQILDSNEKSIRINNLSQIIKYI